MSVNTVEITQMCSDNIVVRNAIPTVSVIHKKTVPSENIICTSTRHCNANQTIRHYTANISGVRMYVRVSHVSHVTYNDIS